MSLAEGYTFCTAVEGGVTAEAIAAVVNAALHRTESHILAKSRTDVQECTNLLQAPGCQFLCAVTTDGLVRDAGVDGTHPISGGSSKLLAAVVRLDLPIEVEAEAEAETATEAEAGTGAATFGMVGTSLAHEKKGLASWLIGEAERRSKQHGAKSLQMHFPIVRQDMATFYGRLGFVHWKDTDMPKKFEHLVAPSARPMVLTWMRKELA